jgi:ABC-type Fe3+ transport system permease subunit
MNRREPFPLLFIGLALWIVPTGWTVLTCVGNMDSWTSLTSDFPRLWRLLQSTLLLATGTATLTTLAGSVIAVVLVRWGLLGQSVWITLLATSAFLPLAVQAGGWISIVGPYGWVTPTDLGLGTGVRTGWPATLAVLAIHAFASLPLVVGILSASLWTRGLAEEEYALSISRRPSALARVMLPIHRDALLLSFFLAMASVWTDMSVTDLFAVRTLTEEIYTEIEGGASGSAATLIAIMFGLLVGTGLSRLLSRWIEQGSVIPREARWRLVSIRQNGFAWTWMLAAVCLLMLLAVPLFGLVRQWIGPALAEGSLARGSCVDMGRVARSVLVAFLAATLATLSASLAAWWSVHASRTGRTILIGMVCAAILIPGPAIGLTLVEMVSRPSPFDLLGRFYDSIGIVIWGEAIRAFPWVYLLQVGVMSRVGQARWETLRLEGASLWMRYRLGPWGEFRWLMLISLVFATAWSMGELATTKIVSPPGFDAVAVIMFGLLHVGTTQAQARLALTIWLVVASLVLVGLSLIGFRKRLASR